VKTLADFKRALTVGTEVELLTLAKNVKAGRLQVGMVRRVTKADTTGVYLQTEGLEGRGSFLGWDKAKDWVFDGDRAINIVWGYSYRVLNKEGA